MPPKRFSKAKAKAKASTFSKAKAKSSTFAKPSFSTSHRTTSHVHVKVVTVVKHVVSSPAPTRAIAITPRVPAVAHYANPASQLAASTSEPPRVTIYVLALANGKFYVGKTARANVDERFEEHRSGSGSAWTRLHRPLGVADVIRDADPFDEDKVTLKCMLQYGMANVRGGSYTRIELLPSDTDAISRLLRGSTDKCFVCGRDGHFAASCPGDSEVAVAATLAPSASHQKVCHRCGRDGHTVDLCYAKTHASGSDWCLRCGREGHDEAACYAKSHAILGGFSQPADYNAVATATQVVASRQAVASVTGMDSCLRCGRAGHTAEACYAKTHANGANWCLRCGREGHEDASCYAKTDATGTSLSEKKRTTSTVAAASGYAARGKKQWRK